MSNIETIGKAVDFIETNLMNPISVGEIADAVFYSVFHFSRMFNSIAKHSPYDYLMKRRLTESALELINTNKKIIDIAFDYQFNNHETFTRAFKRMFHMSPMQFKKEKKYDNRIFLSRLLKDHLEVYNGECIIKPVYKKKEEYYFAGIMTSINNFNEDVKKIWNDFFKEMKTINHIFNEFYGIISYSQAEINKFFYMTAVKCNMEINLNNTSLVNKKIPENEYAVFNNKGKYSNIKFLHDYIYQNWYPKSGLNKLNIFEIHRILDINQEINIDNIDVEILIPLK